MAKKVKAVVKMQVKAGAANPAPPIGSTLGPYGLDLVGLCKEMNEKTAKDRGMIPFVITIYEDRSFDLLKKIAPIAELLKQKLNLSKGSGVPNKDKVATISMADVESIAETKLPDLNSFDLAGAIKQVAGTARSMGITVQE